MSKKNKIYPNIEKLINQAAEKTAKYEAWLFRCVYLGGMKELNISSPIEQAFFIGFQTVKRFSNLKQMQVTTRTDAHDKEHKAELGIEIIPQYLIGGFRADFAIRYRHISNIFEFKVSETIILVECDSQKFHDRTEEERRKEKQRDRFFQCQGYKVFRYTGAELLKDPFTICAELLDYLTDNACMTHHNKNTDVLDFLGRLPKDQT